MLKLGERSNKAKAICTCTIIGGGISGLIAATILQRQGIKVTVLDKGRGIGGRLATRRIGNGESTEGVFDYGTQYFSVKHPDFQPWVDDWLQKGIIREWYQSDARSRYCGVNGTRAVAKYLALNLDVRTGTRVNKLKCDRQWRVYTETEEFSTDILVMTPPVPQSLTLLENSGIELPSKVNRDLKQVDYHRCIAVLALLAEPSNIPQPGGLAVENESLIWLASNYQKGISPNGYAVTLHGTPNFSQAYWDKSEEEIAQKLLAAASTWLTADVIKYQVHRWRYSLPKTFYPQPCLVLPKLSLVMAGDAFVAPKIEGAVLSGIAAAKSITNDLLR